MKNYKKLKNKLISIILTVISLTSFDGFAFTEINSNINTQNTKTGKYQTDKRVQNNEVSVWDKLLNYLKDLNLGDQNSIISSFLAGGGIVSIPWLIGLLNSHNKQKNMIKDFKSLEEKTKYKLDEHLKNERKAIDEKNKIEKNLNDTNKELADYKSKQKEFENITEKTEKLKKEVEELKSEYQKKTEEYKKQFKNLTDEIKVKNSIENIVVFLSEQYKSKEKLDYEKFLNTSIDVSENSVLDINLKMFHDSLQNIFNSLYDKLGETSFKKTKEKFKKDIELLTFEQHINRSMSYIQAKKVRSIFIYIENCLNWKAFRNMIPRDGGNSSLKKVLEENIKKESRENSELRKVINIMKDFDNYTFILVDLYFRR